MIDELYTYACPNLSQEQKDPFNRVCLILGTIFFSSFAIFMGKIYISIILTISYLLLSILTFFDKDNKTSHMKLSTLSSLTVLVTGVCVISEMDSDCNLPLLTIVLGIVFSLIYEVIVIIKIKNKLYSYPRNTRKINLVISSSTVALGILLLTVLWKLPLFSSRLSLIIVLSCSLWMLICIMLLQKLIIYLFTKNKVQDRSNRRDNIS